MADEEVTGAASPPPSDHKRKLDDLDSDPFDPPTAAAESNGNSEPVVDGVGDDESPVNGVAPEDPEVKRLRRVDKPDDAETAENGQQEERSEDPEEDAAEGSAVEKNTEKEEGQEKADEHVYVEDKGLVTVETHTSAIEQESSVNPEESAKGEHREAGGECQDPPPEATQQGDVSGEEQQPTSASQLTCGECEDPRPDATPQVDVSGVEQQPTTTGQLTSRQMEVPTNKVGVLIGKGGDTIRTLQDNSGARIQIRRDADADPHSATRPVELVGSLENINKAEKLIKDVIAEANAVGSTLLVARGFGTRQSFGATEQLQMQVPNEKVGSIIGKGGETIKNLQTRSGACIQLIPQHLPVGDQSKERTLRVTGNRKQIEMAREMIKETMNQPIRSFGPTSGYNRQNFSSRAPASQWGPRTHSSQRAPFPSQNPRYGNYPPPHPYGGQGAHMAAPSGPSPMRSHAPGPVTGPPSYQANYSYGPPPQTAPQGYGEPKYDNHGPGSHSYGSHGPPSAYPSQPVYGQQDQYAKPPAYNTPQPPPYAQPYGPPRPSQPREVPYAQSYGPNLPPQQPYPYAPSGPMQQTYVGPGGYPQQSSQPVTGGPQQAPGYGPSGPTASYGQYPATQPGFAEQAPVTNNTGYGYQGAADPTYAGAPSVAANSQPGGYGNGPVSYGTGVPLQLPPPQQPTGYVQYDSSQMYVGQR